MSCGEIPQVFLCNQKFYFDMQKFYKRQEGTRDMEEFQVTDQCLVVKLPEEIDHHHAGYYSEWADHYILKEKVTNVVFDFERTGFMDSSGIGIIMGRYRKISCFGGKVYAVHADRQILRILKLAGLDKYIEIVREEE